MPGRSDTTRREVLHATSGALVATLGPTVIADKTAADSPAATAHSALGYDRLFSQYNCEGVAPEPIPSDPPEINVRGEEPTATELPSSSEIVVYAYGYNTPPDAGRRLVATFQRALEANDYTNPVVGVQWRAQPPDNGGFADAIDQADEDGRKLAQWLTDSLGDRTVRLVGYSLGTRVALRAVTELDGDAVDIDSLSLLGPAVPGSSVCPDGEFDLTATRAAFAYHSETDPVICGAYEGYLNAAGDVSPPALGCTGADCESPQPNFAGRDVTETIDSHCAYSFRDVGVVEDVLAGFSADPTAETTTPEETPEPTPTETPEPTPTETPEQTPTETPEQTATETPASTATPTEGGDTTADDSGPGFGVVSALAGAIGVGALSVRRLVNWDDE
jgi:PGF-CTERM protein